MPWSHVVLGCGLAVVYFCPNYWISFVGIWKKVFHTSWMRGNNISLREIQKHQRVSPETRMVCCTFNIFGSFSQTIILWECGRQTHHRSVPYIMGIMTGYIMFLNNGKKIYANKYFVFLGWVASLGCIAWINYLIAIHVSLTYDYWREAYAASLCWVIYACHELKSGSFIRSFLSQTFWEPLSKLCLSVYLVHYLYIIISDANRKEIFWLHAWWQIDIYIGDIVVSYILGALLYLSVEAPFAKITRLILDQKFYFQNKIFTSKIGNFIKHY